jgi:hypothetical protein
MRTHRDGPRIAFRDDAALMREAVGWLTIALVVALMLAIAIGHPPPSGRKISATATRFIAAAIVALMLLGAFLRYKNRQQWCEIDHETWTLRLIAGPWLKPGQSTLLREIEIRDIAGVQVEQVSDDIDDIGPRVVIELRNGDRIRVPCLTTKSDARAVQADADTLAALLWPPAQARSIVMPSVRSANLS